MIRQPEIRGSLGDGVCRIRAGRRPDRHNRSEERRTLQNMSFPEPFPVKASGGRIFVAFPRCGKPTGVFGPQDPRSNEMVPQGPTRKLCHGNEEDRGLRG